jgi:hypothetical protein
MRPGWPAGTLPASASALVPGHRSAPSQKAPSIRLPTEQGSPTSLPRGTTMATCRDWIPAMARGIVTTAVGSPVAVADDLASDPMRGCRSVASTVERPIPFRHARHAHVMEA